MFSVEKNTLSATELDQLSIDNMSFVPSKEQRQQLYQQSLIAEQNIKQNQRTNNLSKLSHLSGKIGLCPETLNPNDTVLAGMGSGREVEGAFWKAEGGGTIGNKDILTVLNDKCMPFGGGSNGPNGVLTDCQQKYGENRVNLFYRSEEDTRKLLNDYLELRDSELNSIFYLLVEHLQRPEFTEEYRLDPKKDITPENTLAKELQNDYNNMCSMFEKLDKNKKPLIECGIGCVSYCQTWLRNTGVVGDAQFSVMSPHFQTRFYVVDDKSVISSGVTQEELNSYTTLVEEFNRCMDKPYGIGGGGQAFIHLDKLAKQINQ